MIEYTDVTNLMTGGLTGILKSVIKALNITGGPGILQPWSEASFRVRKPDEIK